MSDGLALFASLRAAAGTEPAAALETLVREGSDSELNRINALAFAAKSGLSEDTAIAVLLHAARLGILEMSWNVLCPGCGSVLESNATLKTIRQEEYSCALCAAGYEPTLDEMVEVTFTVSPRVRRIGAHDPDSLPFWEYLRQIFWGSGLDLESLGDSFERIGEEVCLDRVELPTGEKAILSLQLPAGFIIIMEPVTHWAQFIDVKGEPTRERRNLSVVLDPSLHATPAAIEMRPGTLRIAFDNRTVRRVLPSVWIANDTLHDLLAHRRPFLTAKRLFTNQTFRDIYRTDTLNVDQRLKITSLTFLFTDLKGSTQLYDRVGDLVAFDLVRAHFRVLQEIVASEAGAVVKTIGDAVMATFPTPDRAVAAALKMREAMERLGADHGSPDLLLKIGIHEGPCLAVHLNDRQDYFGQTVNIAARVQGLAGSRSIFASGTVLEYPEAKQLLQRSGVTPLSHRRMLAGIAEEFAVYEIP